MEKVLIVLIIFINPAKRYKEMIKHRICTTFSCFYKEHKELHVYIRINIYIYIHIQVPVSK